MTVEEITDNDLDHELFLKHLDASQSSVWRVAKWLNARGHNVTVNSSSKAEKYNERMEHIDSGDLSISLRVEVKQLSASFTNKKDWPFRNDFIVCAKHSFDIATPKPYGFLYLSKDGSHVAMVMGSTSKHWTVDKRRDNRYKAAVQDFYFCPIEMVIFSKFL